jgi:hypothetical protein
MLRPAGVGSTVRALREARVLPCAGAAGTTPTRQGRVLRAGGDTQRLCRAGRRAGGGPTTTVAQGKRHCTRRHHALVRQGKGPAARDRWAAPLHPVSAGVPQWRLEGGGRGSGMRRLLQRSGDWRASEGARRKRGLSRWGDCKGCVQRGGLYCACQATKLDTSGLHVGCVCGWFDRTLDPTGGAWSGKNSGGRLAALRRGLCPPSAGRGQH